EAAILAGLSELTNPDMIKKAAEIMGNMGSESVLIKGGHGSGGQAQDWLFEGKRSSRFEHPWIREESGRRLSCRGTGCALSSAVAACLSLGEEMKEAVEKGIRLLQEAMLHSCQVGSGYRILGGGFGPGNG
ncbi:MAG: bifunctional hydroxymethylpyrimidine kinase/phosphomethylpyrimidine kinase, partial [bacterium]